MTIIATSIHFFVEYEHQTTQLQHELQELALTFQPTIAQAIWDMNREQLHAELHSLLNLRNIVGISIEDKNGEMLFNQKQHCQNCEDDAFSHHFTITREIFGNPVFLGSATFYSDISVVFERMKINILMLIVNAMIKSTILVTLFVMAFRKYLTRPLQTISAQIAAIDLPKLKHERIQYEDHEYNELVLLRVTLNNTLDKLDDALEKNRQKDALLFQQNKMAGMGEMIGNITHQWKQPLTVLSLIAEEIDMDLEDQQIDPAKLKVHIDKIKIQLKHMNETVRDFQAFFRPDRQMILFNPNEMIRKSCKILSHAIRSEEILMLYDLDETLLCLGYPNELSQVLINLIKNAIDALASQETDKIIRIRSYKKGGWTCIEIQDNGGGIPREIKDRVFEQFFTTKGETSGSGLGLYMSREIIQRHFRGSLEVANQEFPWESQSHFGACFIIKARSNEGHGV